MINNGYIGVYLFGKCWQLMPHNWTELFSQFWEVLKVLEEEKNIQVKQCLNLIGGAHVIRHFVTFAKKHLSACQLWATKEGKVRKWIHLCLQKIISEKYSGSPKSYKNNLVSHYNNDKNYRHFCTVVKEYESKQYRLTLCSVGKHGKWSPFATSLLMTACKQISFSLHLKRLIYHLLLPGPCYVSLSPENPPLLMRQSMSSVGLEWFLYFFFC